MKLFTSPVLNTAAGLLLGIFIAGQLSFVNTKEAHSAKTIITAPALPESISFAGEKVPLDNWDVKERLDREVLINYYNHANVLFLMKMANRYFPIISARLKTNGVPEILSTCVLLKVIWLATQFLKQELLVIGSFWMAQHQGLDWS